MILVEMVLILCLIFALFLTVYRLIREPRLELTDQQRWQYSHFEWKKKVVRLRRA